MKKVIFFIFRKDAIISVEKEDLDKRVSLFIDEEVNYEEKEARFHIILSNTILNTLIN